MSTNYSLIEYPKPNPTYGNIYQGGFLTQDTYQIPGPLFIVTLDTDEQRISANWINHTSIFGDLSYVIPDSPEGVYSDQVLVAIVNSVIGTLETGVNVLIHCWSGVSRSTYGTAAVLMKMLQIDVNGALDLIKVSRPQINPIPAFVAHLEHMEPTLVTTTLTV